MSDILQSVNNGCQVSYDPAKEVYTLAFADGNKHLLSSQQIAQLPLATLQTLGLDPVAVRQPYQGPGSSQRAQSVQQSRPDDPAFWVALDYGTVVRWSMHRRFTYTAVKVRARGKSAELWYTSATEDNPMVPQILTTDELLRLFAQHGNVISHVEIAEKWRML